MSIDEGPFQNITGVSVAPPVTGGAAPTYFRGIVEVYHHEELDDPPPFENFCCGQCPEDALFFCPLESVTFIDAIANYRIDPGRWLTWKNFPVTFLDGEDVVHTVPSFTCTHENWAVGYVEHYDGNKDRFYQDAVLLPTGEPGGGPAGPGALVICSEVYLPGFRGPSEPGPGATGLDLQLQSACWDITAINATGGYVELADDHGLIAGLTVIIEGNPNNSGAFATTALTDNDRVYLNNLASGPAVGRLVYPGAPLSDSGNYTAVAAPTNLYTPRAELAGDVLSAFDTEDATLKLTGAGVYTGTRPVDLIYTATGEQSVILTDTTYSATVTGGTWENKAVRLNSTDTILSGRTLRVDGTPADYDGTYSGSAYSAESYGLKLVDQFFSATASGAIEYATISFSVDGLPTGYNKTVSVTVTGTTNYNGTYSCGAIEIVGGAGGLLGGDLLDVFFVGDESGSYTITSPDTISGNVNATNGDGPHTFTSASKDKTGTVTEVNSRHARVCAGTHAVEVGYSFDFLTGAVYAGESGTVTAVYPTKVDVEVYFAGTDTGTWEATAPIQ